MHTIVSPEKAIPEFLRESPVHKLLRLLERNVHEAIKAHKDAAVLDGAEEPN